MLAQVSLIPAESKKLIAKAVTKMEIVQRALDQGLIVLHPSSSTYFLIEEVTLHKPPTNVWVCGAIVPKGACGEVGPHMGAHSLFRTVEQEHEMPNKPNPGNFFHSWVLRKGVLAQKEPLSVLLGEMGRDDIYIKGVNALDTEGKVGILWGNEVEGGTAALVIAAQRQKGFNVIFPAGLEKLLPFPIQNVAKEARKYEYDYAMGVSCGLLPCEGIVITELRAIEILSGATAIPIASGGLGGAEGAITLVVKGNKDQVTKAIQYIESSKGAKLPQVRVPNCYDCPVPRSFCKFPLGEKHWV